MWTFKKLSRRKVNPQLERLDDRAVPATFGGTGFGGLVFSGPATPQSSSFGMNTPVGLAQTRASQVAGNRLNAQLALSHASFGATPFSHRPFFFPFNTHLRTTSPVSNVGASEMFNTMRGQTNPFVNRSMRFLESSIAQLSPLNTNGTGSFSRAITGLDAVTPTHPYPFGPGGYYSVVNTPSGPAGLL